MATSPPATLPRLILFTRSQSQPPMIADLHQAFSKNPDFNYQIVHQAKELVTAVGEGSRGVLFANCDKKEDVADLYNVLSQFAPRVAEGCLRILVLNGIGHAQLASILRSRCAVEVVEPPTNPKAIQYKIKTALQIVNKNSLQNEKKPSEQKPASAQPKPHVTVQPAGMNVLWEEPVDFQFDTWWIPNRKSIRNVVEVWLIDLLGPGPIIGTWEEVPGLERSGEKAWAWTPDPVAEHVFQTPKGNWIFFGKKPEFSWETNFWSFVSKDPSFAFYVQNSKVPTHVRFELTAEGLRILENSAHTKGLLGQIGSTFGAHLDVPQSARGVLEPNEESITGLGLSKVTEEGIVAGIQAFDRLNLNVEVLRVNGVLGSCGMKPPSVYEVTEVGAMFLLEPPISKVGDRYEFRFKFATGETNLECSMEWELTDVMEWELNDVNSTLNETQLAMGRFCSGDYDPFFGILDRLEERRKELKHFYELARG